MFSFFKKKKSLDIFAPVKGKVLDITDVPDMVFSQKMMGDGVAIEPENDIVVAPCGGKIILISNTKHAIAIESEGVEFLIHIGLDTVELDGKGFESFVEANDIVKKGDKPLKFDRENITAQGKLLTTSIVITNMKDKVESLDKDYTSSDGKVFTVQIK